ncbi:hypothetical protein [Chryseobacterium sp. CT-SW4]|uniref:hypothetical protein n=1 Tax=Chryseobacterium sp. SW-1 TaxID=3157343 RepID=UPI003B017AAB
MKKHLIASIALFSSISIYSQVGINTTEPTSALDVNGDLRVREIPVSTSTDDIALVSDASGVIKKRISESKGIVRGYISSNFTTTGGLGTIYKIPSWAIIDDPNGDFNTGTAVFTAPESGLYRITITATFAYPTSTNVNYVIGLASGDTNTWIMRFSIPDGVLTSDASGYAHTFVGIAQLEAGKTYYYGLSGGITLLSNPTGATGIGTGSFFETQLIKN